MHQPKTAPSAPSNLSAKAESLSRVALLVVAAGKGARFGDPTPKQYLKLGEQTLLKRSLNIWQPDTSFCFKKAVVISPDHEALFDTADCGLDVEKVVNHGATRQSSVLAGLKALKAFNPQVVLIHDAARPLMPEPVFAAVALCAWEYGAALPTLPAIDSLHRIEDGFVVAPLNRSQVSRAQTPQGFRFDPILAAHEKYKNQDASDDVALALLSGMRVKQVDGSELGLKVTTKHDLQHLTHALSREAK